MSDIVRKRFVINIVAAGGVAALAVVLLVNPGDREPPTLLLGNLDKEQIKTIQIQRPQSEIITLEKTDDHWRMRQPWPMAADDLRVGSILNIIGVPSQAQYPAGEVDAADFGLAPPAITLHLNDRVVEFGDVDPLEQRRYLRIGNTVHLVDDTIAPLLMAPPASLVDRHLIPAGFKVARIATERFTLEHDNGEWRVRPQSGLSGTDAVEQRVEQWRETEANAVERLAETPFDTDASTVTLVSRDGSELEYNVVRDDRRRGLYRRENGLFYRLDATTLDGLTGPAPAEK